MAVEAGFCRGAGIALAMALLVFTCRDASDRKEPDHRVNIGLGSAPVTLDPHYSNESVAYTISCNIFESLARTDADMNMVPSLALKWTNPDDLTWDFDLDPEARFHDGRPCTSADAAFSLERARSDPRSDWRGSLVAIDRIETPSKHKLVVHTSKPLPILLRNLTPIAIVPKGSGSLEQHPIGTGPYRFVSVDWQRGFVELRRWDGYRGPKPMIDSGRFYWIPEGKERIHKLKAGQLDLITDVPAETVPALRQDQGIDVLQVPSLRVIFLSFDAKRTNSPYIDGVGSNPFLDSRVRLAVLKAIDRARIVREVFYGLSDEATQAVAPAVFGYNPELRIPAFDLDGARSLMKAAGFARGFNVVLDVPRNVYPGDTAIADFIAASLKQIAINVRINSLDKQSLFKKVADRDTSMYILSWNCLIADASDVYAFLLHTPDPARGYGSDNGGQYENPSLDQLAEAAEQTMDSGRRLELLKQAMAIVVHDTPLVPISIQTHLFALRKPLEWRGRQDKLILFSEMRK